ncbi:MAG: YolD-like family protein [Lachnospiraceae bacterium]|nr:YolD-like family protein [Lachnospiraceae bacterium]
MNNRYADIINLPHHVSKTRPQMPIADRAAQFSPFAALTGYDSAIEETGRLTDSFIELDESRKAVLNEKLQSMLKNIKEQPEVAITYFQPDEKKNGGSYINISGVVKKIDEFEKCLILTDATKIPMKYIFEIKTLV